MTDKHYSVNIQSHIDTLKSLWDKHGALEAELEAAIGYGFDALAESEAHYLANFEPAQSVRNRILEAGRRAGEREGQGVSRFSAGEGNVTDTADYGPATQAHRDTTDRFLKSFGQRLSGSGPDSNLLDAVAPKRDTERGRATASVLKLV
ncbi:MAG: hypothetical protein R3E94_02580 [Burkholderiaceae bacterium]